MANHGPSYGLDAELEAKRAASYDQNLEDDVRAFVERITGESIGPDFHAGLKNGVILCNLANKLKPGSVAKINKSAMPFTQMENINAYLSFARSYGIANTDLFQTVDLFEKKNPNAVIQNLSQLKREAAKKGVAV